MSQGGELEETTALVASTSSRDEDDIIATLVDGALAAGSRRFQWSSALVCCLANASNSCQVMSIALILPLLGESLGASDESKSAVASCIFLGMLMGGVLSGFVSDAALGRKTSVVASTALVTGFGAYSAIVSTAYELAVVRFLVGVGIGGAVPAISAYLTEISSAKDRGQWLVLFCSGWMVGSVLAASLGWIILGSDLTVFGLQSWRSMLLVCSAPAALSCLLSCVVLVESPLFLIHKGKDARALAVLGRIAAINGAPHESLDGIKDALHRRGEAGRRSGGGPQPWLSKMARQTRHLVGSLRHEDTWRMSILLGASWFCLSAGWYGLTIWLPEFLQAKRDNVFLG